MDGSTTIRTLQKMNPQIKLLPPADCVNDKVAGFAYLVSKHFAEAYTAGNCGTLVEVNQASAT